MSSETSNWSGRGKSIQHLIGELSRFTDQTMEVRISVDGGDTSLPISLVGKFGGRYCVLLNCQLEPTPIVHARPSAE